MTEEEKKQVETILEAAVMFGKITDQVKEEILNNIMKSSKIIRPREIAERIGCSQSHVYH